MCPILRKIQDTFENPSMVHDGPRVSLGTNSTYHSPVVEIRILLAVYSTRRY